VGGDRWGARALGHGGRAAPGLSALRSGRRAVDAAEEAVACMESSGAFNAGRGRARNSAGAAG